MPVGDYKMNMKSRSLLGVTLLAIAVLYASTVHVAKASPESYSLRVRFLDFAPDRWIEIDYILAAEFEIPSIGHYDEKRTDCSRYLSQIPPLEFPLQESWIGLKVKLTIFARWHAVDALIDINPNPHDGRWTPQGKQASALIVWYDMGNAPMEGSADGNDDGYLTDLRNDAYIKFVVETLKDGEAIPEFTPLVLTAIFMIATLVIVVKKLQTHSSSSIFWGE
jgi:hypothetical protein